MAYLYLTVAIIAEVIATSALKATDEFRRPGPTAIVVLGYLCAFYFLTLTLRTMQVGVVYALWSGLGVVLVAVTAALVYKQVPDRAAIIGMALIVAGVVVMNLFSQNVSH